MTLSEPIALVLAAALMNAVYTLPMKLNRRWKWEHSWLAFTFLGVAIVPTILAAFTIPHLPLAYDGVSSGVLLGMAACGILWGVSLVFFGMAVDTVGVAITFAGGARNVGSFRCPDSACKSTLQGDFHDQRIHDFPRYFGNPYRCCNLWQSWTPARLRTRQE
jgi:hypothetical protein